MNLMTLEEDEKVLMVCQLHLKYILFPFGHKREIMNNICIEF